MAVLKIVHSILKFGICLMLCQYVIFNIFTYTVAAQHHTEFGGKSWIDNNEYDYFPIDMNTGGGTLNYSIRVMSGHRIDIVLFNEDNYEAYVNNEPADYIEEGSALDRYDIFLTTNLDGGDYFLVIDNTDFGVAAPPSNQELGGVQIEYNIEYTSTSNPFGDGNWIFLVIVFVIIVTIMIIGAFILKKDKSMKSQSSQDSPYQDTQHNLSEYSTYYPDSRFLKCDKCGGAVPVDRDYCPTCWSRIKDE